MGKLAVILMVVMTMMTISHGAHWKRFETLEDLDDVDDYLLDEDDADFSLTSSMRPLIMSPVVSTSSPASTTTTLPKLTTTLPKSTSASITSTSSTTATSTTTTSIPATTARSTVSSTVKMAGQRHQFRIVKRGELEENGRDESSRLAANKYVAMRKAEMEDKARERMEQMEEEDEAEESVDEIEAEKDDAMQDDDAEEIDEKSKKKKKKQMEMGSMAKNRTASKDQSTTSKAEYEWHSDQWMKTHRRAITDELTAWERFWFEINELTPYQSVMLLSVCAFCKVLMFLFSPCLFVAQLRYMQFLNACSKCARCHQISTILHKTEVSMSGCYNQLHPNVEGGTAGDELLMLSGTNRNRSASDSSGVPLISTSTTPSPSVTGLEGGASSKSTLPPIIKNKKSENPEREKREVERGEKEKDKKKE